MRLIGIEQAVSGAPVADRTRRNLDEIRAIHVLLAQHPGRRFSVADLSLVVGQQFRGITTNRIGSHMDILERREEDAVVKERTRPHDGMRQVTVYSVPCEELQMEPSIARPVRRFSWIRNFGRRTRVDEPIETDVYVPLTLETVAAEFFFEEPQAPLDRLSTAPVRPQVDREPEPVGSDLTGTVKPLKRRQLRLVNPDERATTLPAINTQQVQRDTLRLAEGFLSVQPVPDPYTIGPDILPWLREERDVRLVEVTLAENGETFHLGSVVKGNPRIHDAAKALGVTPGEHANKILYTHLPEFLVHGKGGKPVKHRASDVPLYSFGHRGGAQVPRVYVARLNGEAPQDGSEEHPPVVLVVGVCKKADQEIVLGQLTNNSQRNIKKGGKL